MSKGRELSQWRVLAVTLLTIAFAVAATPMWAIFGTPQLVLVVAAALLVGVGLAVLGALRGWSAMLMIVAGVAAFLVIAPPLATPERMIGALPTGEAYATVLPAVWESWTKILTIRTPVGSADGVLVAPLIVMLAASLIGTSIVARSRRAEAAAALPAAVMIWGILWGPRSDGFVVAEALLACVAIAAFVIVVRRSRRRRSTSQSVSSFVRRALGASLAALLALGVGATVQGIPLGDRQVLRGEPSTLTAADIASPLSAIRGQLQPDTRDEVLFTVTGLALGDRVELAALDTYDGEVFGSDDELIRVPDGLGEGSVLGVTVQSLESAWLPATGTATGVTFIGPRAVDLSESLYQAEQSGSLYARAELGPGDGYEVSYQATSPVLDATGFGQLAAYSPGDGAIADRELPEVMLERLAVWTADSATPGQRLADMLAGMQADGYISHGVDDDERPSRSGHSLQRITALFDGLMLGDQEQYAPAAALLANQLGFGARVVVGYSPEVTEGVPTQVRGGDVDAWIEVSTDEAGWVAIDVTPEERPIPEEEASAPQPIDQPIPPGAPVPPEQGQDAEGADTPPAQPAPPPDGSRLLEAVLGWTAVGLGVLALLASPFLILLGAKALRRRRRRRAGTPAAKIDGSWREFVDAIVDRGGTGQGLKTRAEFAERPQHVEFAHQIDRSVFGREEPDAAAVDRMWERSTEIVAELDRGASTRQRLRAKLSPRSLARR